MKNGIDLHELISTVTTDQIEKALEITRKRKYLTLITGNSGRGKSLTARHWAARNPEAVFVDLEAVSSMSGLVRQLTVAILHQEFENTRRNQGELLKFLRENERIIIIDEANQLLFSSNIKTVAKSLEFLRRNIYDLTGTPLVLIFTQYDLAQFKRGSLASFLEQFRRRIGYTVTIPANVLPKSEVKPVLEHYVKVPDARLLATAQAFANAGDGKIAALVKYLDLAREYVAENGGAINSELLEFLREREENGGHWPEE